MLVERVGWLKDYGMEECVNDISTHEHADVMARASKEVSFFLLLLLFCEDLQLLLFALIYFFCTLSHDH